MNLSNHFQARSQQRGISHDMVQVILGLGVPNSRGDLTLLGKKELADVIPRVRKILRSLERLHSHGGGGVAHDNHTYITTFYRTKKFKR